MTELEGGLEEKEIDAVRMLLRREFVCHLNFSVISSTNTWFLIYLQVQSEQEDTG